MTRTKVLAALLATTFGVAVLNAPAPAAAGGFSIMLSPKGKEAKAISTGLKLYSFTQSIKNRAKVDQRGTGNGAAIAQNGSGNVAGIFQKGKNNTATATQNGNNNFLGVFQIGKGNNTNVTQNGNGKVGVVLQGRW